jgi:3-oxoacyl-[acyl-carrier protein] reductase
MSTPRSALVTGAGRGIGRAIALSLAREGLRVTAVARTAGELDSLVAEIHTAGGQAVACAGDLRDRTFAAKAVERAVAAHGGLQVLVNNAGIGGNAPVATTRDEDWDAIFDTNVAGVFRMTRAALPHLTSEGGHIFMISSLAGHNAIAGMAAYCASKAALDQFTACLMLEVRHQGVKVTTVAPGSVDTGFGSRAGVSGGEATAWMLQPSDIAATVCDLLRSRAEAHSSRVEMRPSRPPKR